MYMLENRCDAVPMLPHATPEVFSADNGTVVTYHCDRGFIYKGSLTIHLVCHDRLWNNSADGCQGEHMIVCKYTGSVIDSNYNTIQTNKYCSVL